MKTKRAPRKTAYPTPLKAGECAAFPAETGKATRNRRQAMLKTGATAKPEAPVELTIDEWYDLQDRSVEKLHQSMRLKRRRNRTKIDDVELGRRASTRIAQEQKQFVDAVMLARAICRITATGDSSYGADLIDEAWSDVAPWFRDAHARFYGPTLPKSVIVPARRAAFTEHEDQVRREVESEMCIELEAAKDGSALEERKGRWRESEIEGFANNLETARIIYQRHPGLLTAKSFPEPYRAAIIQQYDYDPQERSGTDVDDLHITDPAEAELKFEQLARESLASCSATAAKGKQ